MNHLPRFLEGHTFDPGQYRRAVHNGRSFAPRVGHHPRDPARLAHAEPTARMPAVVPGPDGHRQELGREGEERALEEARRRQAEDTGSRRVDGTIPGQQAALTPQGQAHYRTCEDRIKTPELGEYGVTPALDRKKLQTGHLLTVDAQYVL